MDQFETAFLGKDGITADELGPDDQGQHPQACRVNFENIQRCVGWKSPTISNLGRPDDYYEKIGVTAIKALTASGLDAAATRGRLIPRGLIFVIVG